MVFQQQPFLAFTVGFSLFESESNRVGDFISIKNKVHYTILQTNAYVSKQPHQHQNCAVSTSVGRGSACQQDPKSQRAAYML